MLSIYTSYVCKACKKEFILLTEEVKQLQIDRYIACPYCNSKRVKKQSEINDLRELMDHRTYKRVYEVIKQNI